MGSRGVKPRQLWPLGVKLSRVRVRPHTYSLCAACLIMFRVFVAIPFGCKEYEEGEL